MPVPKILFLVNSLHTGGAERNLVSICQHIDRDRFHPEVWRLIPGGEFEQSLHAAGIAIRDLQRKSPYSLRFALRAARQIAQTDAKLIHSFFPTVGFYAALAKTLFGLRIPLVYWMGTPKARWLDVAMYRWFAHCYDRVVANSISVKRVIESLGFAADRVVVIPNGHDLDRFAMPFDRQRIRRELGAGRDEQLVVFVGRLIESKRVTDAIDAIGLLLPGFPRIKLAIVGEGAQRRALEEHARQAELADRICFAGLRTDVPDVLRSADLFVFPSESEGLPNSVIEACLAGLPIVACSVPGVTDVLTNGEHGLLVPPRDPPALAKAIELTLTQREPTQRRVVAARELAVARYSIDRFMNELYAVYDELLAERQCAEPHHRRLRSRG